jgi:hypothetical protein
LSKILRVLFVLWAGSLWGVVWAALILFNAQPDRHLAGAIAARLFAVETYLGLAVALLAAATGRRAQFRWGFFAAALLLVNEWGLKPLLQQARVHGSALGLGFGPWHGISAMLYLAACAAVLVVVWKDALR